MKILLAVDGSPCSDAAVEEICRRSWPAGSEVMVLHVLHASIPLVPDPFLLTVAAHMTQLNELRERAPRLVERDADVIRRADAAGGLAVTTRVVEGSPKQVIVDEAASFGADLIVLGCHGYGPVKRFVLGSVSHAVVLHAGCSVEVVRCAHAAA